ncbi:hypothetical protein HanIR_Chr13g0642781 [Helianthus annuus]|nr:hypothetical protein HanIR_Chr13g0642781 [Helianthus annuus]
MSEVKNDFFWLLDFITTNYWVLGTVTPNYYSDFHHSQLNTLCVVSLRRLTFLMVYLV